LPAVPLPPETPCMELKDQLSLISMGACGTRSADATGHRAASSTSANAHAHATTSAMASVRGTLALDAVPWTPCPSWRSSGTRRTRACPTDKSNPSVHSVQCPWADNILSMRATHVPGLPRFCLDLLYMTSPTPHRTTTIMATSRSSSGLLSPSVGRRFMAGRSPDGRPSPSSGTVA